MSSNSKCYSEEELIACLEGTLPQPRREAIETHVAVCESCTKIVDAINQHLLRECGSDSEGDHSPLEIGKHDGAPTDALEPSETVDYLGKLNGYDIIRVLGRGGYGIVFEAQDSALHRNVAIKVLTRDLSKQAISRRRFIREARACASINHPNVVTIHGVEDSGDTPFIVMELIQGETLRERIRREPRLDLLDILRISSQVAQGLAAAHGQGIIHRDVKPANIMLLDLLRVKIADFGLARVATEDVELTSRGVAVGTPSYMSPEQVRGEELDPRSDLFAMGCVIYAMFTGHSPFHGKTALEIAMRIETHRPPRLAEVSKGVPEFIDSIVARLLEKDRDQRFQSAAEVADVLSRHLAILNQTPTDKFPVALRMSMLEPTGKPKRPRRLILFGVLAMLVCALSVGGWHYVSPNRANAPLDGVDTMFESGTGSRPSVLDGQRKQEVTVAQTGDADFTTIGEALRNVGVNAKVTIEDDAEYVETIILKGSARYEGVQIVSPKHATIRNEDLQAVITIHAVPRARLEGLRIVARQEQVGIELGGDCSGTELFDLEIDRIANPDDSSTSNAAIAIRNSAAGSAEQPIHLHRLVCHNTNVGIAIVNRTGDQPPPQHIVIEECAVRGLSRDDSTLLALIGDIRNIQIQRNLFSNGLRAISMLTEAQWTPSNCDISHNTWHQFENTWLGWSGPVESSLSINVQHNLILDSGQIDLPPALLSAFNGLPPAFTGNTAVVSSAAVRGRFSPLADVIEAFPLLSEDPKHRDYLKPDFDQLEKLDFVLGSVPGRYSGDENSGEQEK